MKLESQVASLELSKRLKELGARQESLFIYQKTTYEGSRMFKHDLELSSHDVWTNEIQSHNGYISAFTVAELGELLPKDFVSVKHSDQKFRVWKILGAMDLEYIGSEYGGPDATADTEADARAKMLVYLLENNLVTL